MKSTEDRTSVTQEEALSLNPLESTKAQPNAPGTTSGDASAVPNGEPVVVALVQEPLKGPIGNELSEELTEFLLVKWQQLKADASAAGGVSRVSPTGTLSGALGLALSTGASSDVH